MSDPVRPEAVEAALSAPLGGPVRWLGETTSTNDDLAALARQGSAEGTVIGADHQTAGRGRRGRVWTDEPARAVAMSILLRPRAARSPGLLPLIVALGIADGLASLVREEIGIVWPNDLVIDGRKCTGILCEMGWQGGAVDWAVAGVGINVEAAPRADEGARFEPTSLRRHGFTGTRQEVVIAALRGLSSRYDQWQSAGPAPALAAYRERDALNGRQITVSVDDREGTRLTGVGAGVDHHGRLVVAGPDGERRLSAAEVQHVRR